MLSSNARAALRWQTAYQVLVASSAGLLRQNKGDLWDSSRVGDDYTESSRSKNLPANWWRRLKIRDKSNAEEANA